MMEKTKKKNKRKKVKNKVSSIKEKKSKKGKKKRFENNLIDMIKKLNLFNILKKLLPCLFLKTKIGYNIKSIFNTKLRIRLNS